jgi:hypothetical protein
VQPGLFRRLIVVRPNRRIEFGWRAFVHLRGAYWPAPNRLFFASR